MTVVNKPFPHVLIRASAGTGKTFQLSNRYLGLAVAGVVPDEILATTFTRKAAGEILERILFRLAEAANDAEKVPALGNFIGAKLDRDRAQQVLEQLVHHLHRLHVSTLDSFFAQIARSFDLELGLPPGWRIVDESADGRLRSEAIQAVLTKGESQDVRSLLHLLTKGEATRSISEQLRSLVNGLYGLYLETAADAWDRLPRPSRLTDEKLAEAIEAISRCALPNHKKIFAAREKDLALARAGDWATFIEGGLANRVLCEQSSYYGKDIDDSVSETYRPLLHHARAVLVGQVADQTKATRDFLERFDAEYRRLKAARRAMRFDDITRALADSQLSQRSQQVAFRLDSQICHVLLDEFQDTSLAQWKVVRPLVEAVMGGEAEGLVAMEPPSPQLGSSVGNALRGVPQKTDGSPNNPHRNATECVPHRGKDNRSFFCVGDVKQAIYGWRGGVAELFDELGSHWPELDQPSLTESRRSSQPIIDTVNRVFRGLSDNPVLQKVRPAVEAWGRGFDAHTTARHDLCGYVRMATGPLADVEQEGATLEFAAREIKRLVTEAPQRSVGVLVRDNDAVASIIRQLRQLGIYASEEGGNPLTDSPAVLVVLSLLALADHPGDTTAGFHVASSKLGAMLEFTDHRDARAAEQLSLRVRQQLLALGYGPTIYRWARVLAESCDPRDASRLLQLVELAYRYEADASLRTRDFVAFVEHERVEAPSPADVRVMTIHQAKGLQFDIVVLPQLDVRLTGQTPPVVIGRPRPTEAPNLVCRYANEALQKLLPDEAQAAFDQYCEHVIRESLCVLYVALTRAIHALHMIVAPSKEKESDLPALLSGVLRAALTDGQPLPAESLVYEHGDCDWFKTGTKARTVAIDAIEQGWPRKSAFQVALAPAEKRRRVLERESPSELAHRAQIDLATRMAVESSRAVNRGSVFHAWFEQIEWLDDGVGDDEAMRQIGLRLGALSSEVEEWLPQFRAKLQSPRLRAVLERSSYLSPELAPWRLRPSICAALGRARPTIDVYRERPFAVRLGDKLLSGTFDRLVLVRCGSPGRIVAAEVIDYKTDAIAPADDQAVAKIIDRYRPQLSAYRQAVAAMFGLADDRILTRLAVIEAEQVAIVDQPE